MKHLTFVDADSPGSLYAAIMQADSLLEPGCFAIVVTPETGTGAIRSMEWLSRKGILPCMIHITSQIGPSAEPSSWKHMMHERGWPVFEIRQLQELPAALEGGGTA
ncbi:hypothetical protein D3C78_1575460 [compost metagenome]